MKTPPRDDLGPFAIPTGYMVAHSTPKRNTNMQYCANRRRGQSDMRLAVGTDPYVPRPERADLYAPPVVRALRVRLPLKRVQRYFTTRGEYATIARGGRL